MPGGILKSEEVEEDEKEMLLLLTTNQHVKMLEFCGATSFKIAFRKCCYIIVCVSGDAGHMRDTR